REGPASAKIAERERQAAARRAQSPSQKRRTLLPKPSVSGFQGPFRPEGRAAPLESSTATHRPPPTSAESGAQTASLLVWASRPLSDSATTGDSVVGVNLRGAFHRPATLAAQSAHWPE